MELNESPVFLLFHTQQNVIRKDLPVSLYESGKPAILVMLLHTKRSCNVAPIWSAYLPLLLLSFMLLCQLACFISA